MTRDQMIAHLVLHGWEPIEALSITDTVYSILRPDCEIWLDGAGYPTVHTGDHEIDDGLNKRTEWSKFTSHQLRVLLKEANEYMRQPHDT